MTSSRFGLLSCLILMAACAPPEPRPAGQARAPSLATQPLFSSAASDQTEDVAWGDMDGDGDLDLAVANLDDPNRVYRNDDGAFVLAWTSGVLSQESRDVAWIDLDQDGLLDVVFANTQSADDGYLNRWDTNPNSPFPAAPDWQTTAADSSTGLAVGDVDGDGTPDLAVSFSDTGSRGARVYLNTGAGLETTATWTSSDPGPAHGLCLGDWDGDTDLDLAVVTNVDGNGAGLEHVFANAGTGAANGDTGLASTAAWTSTSSLRRDLRDCAWVDWDGDGDLDLAAVASEYLGASPNGVYENLGGTLSADFVWDSGDNDESSHVAIADWDGDGDPDLAAFNEVAGDAIYVNDGTGAMSLAWRGVSGSRGGDLGDMDGDGDIDIAMGHWQAPVEVVENLASPLVPGWTGPAQGVAGAFADMDGDGDLDLAVAGNTVTLWLNDGEGGFGSAADWTSSESADFTDVAWADLDGDGLPDLGASTTTGAPVHVWTNSAAGLGATASWSSPELDASTALAFADVDADGDLDLAVANDGVNRLYLNAGGVLSLGVGPAETETTTALAWGDQDGDGLPELAVVNGAGEPARVYANAAGSLTSAWTSSAIDLDHAVAWGDADGDGDLDLAIGSSGADRVYENTAAGLVVSSAAWTSPAVTDTTDLVFTDADGDGALDLLTAGAVVQAWTPTTLLGFEQAWSFTAEGDALVAGDLDGRGGLGFVQLATGDDAVAFENPGGFSVELAPPPGGTTFVGTGGFADVDGDGDLDAVFGTPSLGTRSWLNTGTGFVVDWEDPLFLNHNDIAWADVDGDGALDFSGAAITSTGVVDNVDRLYLNDGVGQFTDSPSAALNIAENTNDHEWFDVDGDADLDLVTVGTNNFVRLFTNDGGVLTLTWDSGGTLPSRRAKAVDWDGDGDLDLLVGHSSASSIHLFENANGTLGAVVNTSLSIGRINDFDLGDWDGDGDLDLAVATPTGIQILLKQGAGIVTGPSWTSVEHWQARFLDWDGDGGLEVVTRAYNEHIRIFANDAGQLRQVWRTPEARIYRGVDAGDLDGDGDVDLIASSEGQAGVGAGLYVFTNGRNAPIGLPSSPPTVQLLNPSDAPLAGLAQTTTRSPLVGSPTLEFLLTDVESDPAPSVRVEYSVNSGAFWQAATVSGATTDLAASPAGTLHTLDWDIAADGVGADRVELRIVLEGASASRVTEPTLRARTSSRLPPLRAHPCYPLDADSDGVGCALDCDDADATVFPGASEACDSVDSDCDGSLVDGDADLDGDGLPDCVDDDDDGDGVTDATDCDDADAAVYPGAPEVSGNTIDEDCNGIDALDCFEDSDGDTYGSTTVVQELDDGNCTDDAGQADVATDCDDGAAAVHPGAVQICNGVDDDCGGLPADESDGDADGVMPCAGDCDDADAARFPGNPEVCDGQDNDCDAATDEDVDNDGDGFSECDDDCDDAEPAVAPGAVEICDGLDNDCDTGTDEFADIDGDGRSACVGDCDEADAATYEGAPELCDGADNDCDGAVPADETTDVDDDGAVLCADCADDDAAVFPDAEELCNGIDDDCDATTDEDFDSDGDGVTICGGDCDDADVDVGPDAVEVSVVECTDGVDNDCNAVADADEPTCADALDPDLSPGCRVACSASPDGAAPWGLAVLGLLLLRRRRRPARWALLAVLLLFLPGIASAGDVLIISADASSARAEAVSRLPPGTAFVVHAPTETMVRDDVWVLGGSLGALCPAPSLTAVEVDAALAAAEARIDSLDTESGADELIELRNRLGCLGTPVDPEVLWRLHFYEAVIGWYAEGAEPARAALIRALAVRPGAAFDDAYPPAMRDVFQEAQQAVEALLRSRFADAAGFVVDGASPSGTLLIPGEHLAQRKRGEGVQGALLQVGEGVPVVFAPPDGIITAVGELGPAEQNALGARLRADFGVGDEGSVWLVHGGAVFALGEPTPQPIVQEKRRALLAAGPVLQVGLGVAHEQVGPWPYLAVPVDLDLRLVGPIRLLLAGRIALGATRPGVLDPDQRYLPLLVPFGGGIALRLDGPVAPVVGVIAHFAVDENQGNRRLLAGPAGWVAAEIALGRSALALRPHLAVGSLGRWFHLRAGVQAVVKVGRP